MRLRRYIIESLTAKEATKFTELMKRECSDIIHFYKKRLDARVNRPFIWRGLSGSKMSIRYEKMHKNRNPLSTGQDLHNWMNKHFKERFGWPVRNGVSTTGNRNMTAMYGHPYVFFPKDGFDFCWSPKVNDLWGAVEQIQPLFNKSEKYRGFPIPPPKPKNPEDDLQAKYTYESWQDLLKLFDTYSFSRLKDAVDSGNEIMFNTPNYYLVNANESYSDVELERIQNQRYGAVRSGADIMAGLGLEF